MADDLDAFFNKKKSKTGKKKKAAVQDVNALAKKLEHAVKRQEKADQEEEQQQRAREAETEKGDKEDSEWHDYVDSEQAVTDVNLKITAIDLEQEHEKEAREQEEEEAQKKAMKGWSNLEKKEKGSDEDSGTEEPPVHENNPPEEPKGPSKYVPPSMRFGRRPMGGLQTDKAPDIANDEAFPTLGAADEIQQKQEAEKKQLEQLKMREMEAKMASQQTAPPPQQTAQARLEAELEEKVKAGKYVPRSAWAQVGKEPPPTSAAPPARPSASPTPPPPAQDSPARNPKAYVPPHLRK